MCRPSTAALLGAFLDLFAATTNVGFTVTVTDLVTDHQVAHHNKDLTPAPPVQHTSALGCS
jgi:hypothetical protein